jgi:hypothetical protein
MLVYASTSVLVLYYDMGFGAPAAVRVLVEHDTVVAVTYNQGGMGLLYPSTFDKPMGAELIPRKVHLICAAVFGFSPPSMRWKSTLGDFLISPNLLPCDQQSAVVLASIFSEMTVFLN